MKSGDSEQLFVKPMTEPENRFAFPGRAHEADWVNRFEVWRLAKVSTLAVKGPNTGSIFARASPDRPWPIARRFEPPGPEPAIASSDPAGAARGA